VIGLEFPNIKLNLAALVKRKVASTCRHEFCCGGQWLVRIIVNLQTTGGPVPTFSTQRSAPAKGCSGTVRSGDPMAFPVWHEPPSSCCGTWFPADSLACRKVRHYRNRAFLIFFLPTIFFAVRSRARTAASRYERIRFRLCWHERAASRQAGRNLEGP